MAAYPGFSRIFRKRLVVLLVSEYRIFASLPFTNKQHAYCARISTWMSWYVIEIFRLSMREESGRVLLSSWWCIGNPSWEISDLRQVVGNYIMFVPRARSALFFKEMLGRDTKMCFLRFLSKSTYQTSILNHSCAQNSYQVFPSLEFLILNMLNCDFKPVESRRLRVHVCSKRYVHPVHLPRPLSMWKRGLN